MNLQNLLIPTLSNESQEKDRDDATHIHVYFNSIEFTSKRT